MKKLSIFYLAHLVSTKRKEKFMTQQQLSDATGINRALLSRLEKQDFIPFIPQLEALDAVLDFEPDCVFENSGESTLAPPPTMNIAVARTGYVGLSMAVLLAQNHTVTAIDIIPEKVDLINRKKIANSGRIYP